MDKNKNKQNITENFTLPSDFNVTKNVPEKNCNYTGRINYICKAPDNNKKTPSQVNFLPDRINVNHGEYNTNFEKPTDNQRLVGGPNPKTLVPPVLAVPAMDIDYWRSNNKLNISMVNDQRPIYNDESGYNISRDTYDNLSMHGNPVSFEIKKQYKKNKYKQVEVTPEIKDVMSEMPRTELPQEKFSFPYEVKSSKQNYLNPPDELFNKNFKEIPYLKDSYNENVFTQIISPGSNYYKNEINEPINSNMGITHQQQFPYKENEIIEPFEGVNTSNVYDPRFYGYGTSYRNYIEDVTGQPRFYYDDINAVRMPNYITRNHIDVTPFGDSYGSLNDGNDYTSNIHTLADKHYLDSTMNFRNEMQERLMRKRNADAWQQKAYPINKHSQRH